MLPRETEKTEFGNSLTWRFKEKKPVFWAILSVCPENRSNECFASFNKCSNILIKFHH